DRLPLPLRDVQQDQHLRLLPRAGVRPREGGPRSERHEGRICEGDRVAGHAAGSDPTGPVLPQPEGADLRGLGDRLSEGPAGEATPRCRESGRTHGGVPVAGTAATDTLERGTRIRRAVSDPASLDRLLRQARRRTILFAFATFLVISALLTPRWIREPPPLTLHGF